MNPYKEAEESSFISSLHVSYEDIASKLLKDHFFLTALELHTELVESGKELPQLREFFSNPGNFEQHVTRAADFTSMHRTPSLATLDSLDTARYSEDGGGDRAASGGEVAVLEFELRKAKETISALRANLTQFAGNGYQTICCINQNRTLMLLAILQSNRKSENGEILVKILSQRIKDTLDPSPKIIPAPIIINFQGPQGGEYKTNIMKTILHSNTFGIITTFYCDYPKSIQMTFGFCIRIPYPIRLLSSCSQQNHLTEPWGKWRVWRHGRRLEWLKAVGREDLLTKLTDEKIRQQYRICEEHFETTCFKFSKNGKLKYLYANAFPTLNLPSNDGSWSVSQCANVSTKVSQDEQAIATFTANTPGKRKQALEIPVTKKRKEYDFDNGESSLEKKFADNTQRTLKPHEKRALNFLINEYLLLQDYKLTSITFSDENPDQEFEDWDDVGLNMPRPDGLVSLFWGGTSKLSPKVDVATETDKYSFNVQCQTETEYEESVCSNCQGSMHVATDWSHEVLIQAEEIQVLKQNILALQTEKLNFQKLYDEAIVTLNSLTSPTSESRDLVLQLPEDRVKVELDVDDIKVESNSQEKPITYMASENHYGSGNSTHSATPDQFEMVYSEKNNIVIKKEKEDTYEQPVYMESSNRGSPLRPGSINTLESLSINDASEWTRVQDEAAADNTKETWIKSNIIPNNLKEMLLNLRQENFNQNEIVNDLLLELSMRTKPIKIDGLLPLVAETLPRILPHTLLARRGEAAALLAAGAALAGGARRARLLHALLTMYKKPDSSDAHLVCQAACLVVKWGGSGEVLSAMAELLASKTAERRLLASQVCLAIAPYVPLELCTSLFLSLVTLMCESSEREIRAIGLVAASFVCPVGEHMYYQLESIMFNFLKDPYERNVQNTVNILLPVMTRCALNSDKFHSELYRRTLSDCAEACQEGEWKTVVLYIEIMRAVVLAKFVYVANVDIVKDTICDTDDTLQEVPLSETASSTDLESFLSQDVDVKQLLASMNCLLKNKPNFRWPELNWMITTLHCILVEVTGNSKMLHHHVSYESLITLFNTYIERGGALFTSTILKPVFVNLINGFETKLERLDTISNDMFIVIGVYLATVLVCTEKAERCGIFLQKWLVYCSTRAMPVDVFSVPLKWLAKHKPDDLSMFLKHLHEFSTSVDESTNVGVIRTYIAALVTELLNTSAVGGVCLQRQVAPLVLELLDDRDAGVRESAYMAWGRVWFESSRVEGEGAALLASKAGELLQRPLSAREAARMAHALALLVTEESQLDIAVSTLSKLAGAVSSAAGAAGGAAGAVGGEAVAALSAALQLAAHHAPAHPALLPAARKLETIVQVPSLSQYKPTVDALLQRVGGAVSVASVTPSPRLEAATEVGRRVTQMFSAKAGKNIQNIFKKKT